MLSADNNSTADQREQKSQSQVFNFQKQRNVSDTYITLFLAGIHLQSETTEAGFKYNYTDFIMNAEPINDDTQQPGMTYTFRMTIMTSGRVSIYSIQFFYIAYEKSKVEGGGRFILNSGKLSLDSFGGMVSQSYKSASIPQLYQEFYLKTEALFFGLNDLRARNAGIRIMAVEQIAGFAEELSYTLVMQTWYYTFIENAAFSYIQVKKIRCDKDPYLAIGLVNCPTACAQYFFMANQTCLPCHYSCATCSNSTACDSCSTLGTRHLNNTCRCNSGYYETLQLDCIPCSQNCLECESSAICTSCRKEHFRFLNPVTRDCQCQFGYISLNSGPMCKPCVVGCSNCISATTCSTCLYGYFWVNNTFCSQLCNHTQSYNYSTNACDNVQASSFSSGGLQAKGKFDYNWYYGFNGTDLTIYMTITKPDVLFYYYQGGNGYNMSGLAYKGNGNGSGSAFRSGSESYFGSGSGFGSSYGTAFFDDGNGFYKGYSSSRGASNVEAFSQNKQWNSWTTTTDQSYSQSDVDTGLFSNGSFSRRTVVSTEGTTTTTIRNVAADGAVVTRTFTIPSNTTSYFYMNTGEVNRYRMEGEPDNANYADALNQNLELRIDGDLVPIRVVGSSANSFVITAKPSKSYINGRGILTIKDQGLIVYDKVVGIQDNSEPITIFRYDRYSEEMIKQSTNLHESNSLLVQIVWGVCRVLLFLGLGWPVMPVMLSMQYIFAHAYISAKMPLNVDYFLRSFEDFRNPSLLLPRQRDSLDNSIFPAANSIYKVVPAYNMFDRGIDFLFNDFQLLMTCLLSFLLLAMLYAFAVLVLASSDYVISPIMNYFWRRKMLHLGAYALVTALPLSFYFFGQMNDFGGGSNSKYTSYCTFNMLISLLSFGGLMAVPPMLAYLIYNKLHYERIYRAKEDVQMMVLLKHAVQNSPNEWHLTQHNQPLWSIDDTSKLGYLWACLLYYKLMLFAWALSFFGENSSYQLMGMVAINAGFFLFTLFSSFFGNSLYKLYFLTQLGTMIAYEVIMATLSSDRSMSTEGLMNVGYLAIGLLYLMWVPALLLSVWRLWDTFKHLFANYFSKGKFLLFQPKTVSQLDNLTPVRDRTLTGRKSTIFESKRLASRMGSQVKRSNMVPGSQMLFRTPNQEDEIVEKSIGGEGYSTLGLKSNAIIKKVATNNQISITGAENNEHLTNGQGHSQNGYLSAPDRRMKMSVSTARNLQISERQDQQQDFFVEGRGRKAAAEEKTSSPNPTLTHNQHACSAQLNQQLHMQFANDPRIRITTDKRIVMRAVPPIEPLEQVEYIPSIKSIVQHTIHRKSIVSQRNTYFNGANPPVVGMSPQLMQAAIEQPYSVESSSVGPRGRTVVLRQMYAHHNIYLILSEVQEVLWQKLTGAGAQIELTQTGQLHVNGKVENANFKIEQVPHASQVVLGNKLVLWKVVGNTLLFRSQNNGAVYPVWNVMDRSLIQHLADPQCNITLENSTIFVNGGQFYRLPVPPSIPAGQQRLVFGGMEGTDAILINVANGHVIRLEDITDSETVAKLKNEANVVTTNGETVYVNGEDICNEEDDEQDISEAKVPIHQSNELDRGKGMASILSPTSAGTSHIQPNSTAQQTHAQTYRYTGARIQIAAVPPADFTVSETAFDNAEWISDELTSAASLSSLVEFLRENFPGCKYLIHDMAADTYVEGTPEAFQKLRLRFSV